MFDDLLDLPFPSITGQSETVREMIAKSNQPRFMSKIDTVLSQDINSPFMEKDGYGGYLLNVPEAKDAIKNLFLELIKFQHTSDIEDELLEKIKVRITEL